MKSVSLDQYNGQVVRWGEYTEQTNRSGREDISAPRGKGMREKTMHRGMLIHQTIQRCECIPRNVAPG